MKKRSLTGDRPTGRLHLGHYVGSLQNRLELQKKGYEQFVMIADTQALSAHAQEPQLIRKNILELALDYLAVGLDPKKTTIFIQSLVPEIAELTMYFLNLVTISRLGQNPTVKTEMMDKGFKNSVPAGFYMHPVNQAADILIFRPDVVPVGEDQLPMIEQTNEIAEKFNRTYKKVFKKAEAIISKTPRLAGTDGKAKMGKSLGNAIFLADSDAEIREKVKNMYTDPKHIHVSDPGRVDGNEVFMYLDIFDQNKKELEVLKRQYKRGGLGDVILKNRLAEMLIGIIRPIRMKREEFAKDPKRVMRVLEEGTKRACAEAAQTMRTVRKAMKIDYFE